MSGVVKAIGKAFKPIIKVLKKIAIPVLIVGAIVLTAGAAIPALGAAMGMAGGIGGVLGSIGISGPMAAVLGGAIKGIAIGAGTGAIGSLLTGGNIWKGIKKGALIGGITGGVMGALGPQGFFAKPTPTTGVPAAPSTAATTQAEVAAGAPAPDLSIKPTPAFDSGASNVVGEFTKAPGTGAGVQTTAFGIENATVPFTPVDTAALEQATSVQIPGVDTATGNVATNMGGANSGGGLASNPGPWMMGGQVISGLGSGLVGMAGAKAEAKENRRIARSYEVDPSAYLQLNGQVNPAYPSPSERFADTSSRYYYDPRQGRVMPVAGNA